MTNTVRDLRRQKLDPRVLHTVLQITCFSLWQDFDEYVILTKEDRSQCIDWNYMQRKNDIVFNEVTVACLQDQEDNGLSARLE